MSSELARILGAVGAVGLVLLSSARGASARAGLVAWAVGCGALAISSRRTGTIASFAAAVLGLIAAGAGAWIVLRKPWLLALATLACVPAPSP